MARVRQLLCQSRPEISELLRKTPFRGARAERLAAMGDGGSSFDQLNPGPPADAFHEPDASPRDRGYDVARQLELGADSPYHNFVTNQVASTPGRHRVAFGKRGPAAGLPAPPGTPPVSSQGATTGESAGPATLLRLPMAGAPPQQRNVFLTKHKIFAFAFLGACPRQVCLFNHDPSLMPTGYFRAHAAKRRAGPDGGRKVSRPKRRLYALSDEQAFVVVAYLRRGRRGDGRRGGMWA